MIRNSDKLLFSCSKAHNQCGSVSNCPSLVWEIQAVPASQLCHPQPMTSSSPQEEKVGVWHFVNVISSQTRNENHHFYA